MTWKMRGAYGLLALAMLFAAFGAGYRVRAQGESGWMPSGYNAAVPLVRTAEGNLMVSAGSKGGRGAGKTRASKPNLKPWETLNEVHQAIRANFVHPKEISEDELTYGAIRGMLRSLGDRFTRFLTPSEFEKFNEQTSAEFTGIGARIDIKDDYEGSEQSKPFSASRPIIVDTIKGSPASRSTLKKDDVILAIDGRSTADMGDDAVVSYIKGVRGTTVKLKIERRLKAAQMNRDSEYKVFDVEIKRDLIEMHPVDLEWLPGRIAWLKLEEFNKKSDAEMGKALSTLKQGPVSDRGAARGLILDMRNNPGGLLDVAVDIGSRFVPDGAIVYTKENDGREQVLKAERNRYMNFNKMPIVVLINNYSASAAEIVAGAMKDRGLATVVGEPSFGKASVQVLLQLKNGGALVITTAKYLTPLKRDISDKGIAPDIVVKATDEDEAGKSGRGAQLEKAIAIIQQKNGGPTVAAR